MKYSISDLERLTGVKSHTIRMWEQRYKILTPQRTKTNIRMYDNEQLRRLLNIVTLINRGWKVSEVSKLSPDRLESELDQLLLQDGKAKDQYETFVNALVGAGLDYDEQRFDKTFSTCCLRFGEQTVIQEVVYPVLGRIGLMWMKSQINPAQEHFVSNLVKQKLYTAIDGLVVSGEQRKKYLLYLPEWEQHEIGLLYAHYLLRKEGFRTTYLGSNVPFEHLVQAYSKVRPDVLCVFFVAQYPVASIQEHVNHLSNTFFHSDIVVSGNNHIIDQLRLPRQFYHARNVEEFGKYYL